MGKVQWGKYLWQLALVIIPVPITILLTVYFVQDRGSVRHFEYTRSVREAFLTLPEILPSKLQLTFDGDPVQNLSSVKFQVFNRTGKSYQDVKIFFTIEPHKDSSSQLLSKDIQGPEGFPLDGFQELTPKASSVGWSIETINSSSSLLDAFEVTFVFLGQKAPQVEIAILKTGVELMPLEPQRTSTVMLVIKIGLTVILSLLYVTFLVFMFKLGRKSRSRFRETLRLDLAEYFEKHKGQLQNFTVGSLVDGVYSVYENARIITTDPIIRKLMKLFRFGALEVSEDETDSEN